MADGVFNISKGRVVEFYNRVENNDPATATIEIMQADATLIDHDDYAALLTPTANVEATFTNYVRKNLTDVDLAALPLPDDTNDRYDIDIPDITWTAAGNTTNNTLVKFITGYDPTAGADSTILPMTHHDFSVTTDGSDVTAQINAAGFFRAA
jgi:hypothetical protein